MHRLSQALVLFFFFFVLSFCILSFSMIHKHLKNSNCTILSRIKWNINYKNTLYANTDFDPNPFQLSDCINSKINHMFSMFFYLTSNKPRDTNRIFFNNHKYIFDRRTNSCFFFIQKIEDHFIKKHWPMIMLKKNAFSLMQIEEKNIQLLFF